MPTSPSKRPSAGGRFGRLLGSLRAPAARAGGTLPVQTGFPTSLADLVVKNRGRLKNPTRRRRRPSLAVPPSPLAERTPPVQQETHEVVLTTVHDAAVRRPKAAAFGIRPAEVLAVGGAVALALLVVWSRWLVVAATVASVSLLWIESVAASTASLRRPRPEPPEDLVLGGRGRVSPIREAESSESSSCADSDRGSEVSSLWSTDTAGLDGGGEDDSVAPKRKDKRRSLRKLFARKPRDNGKRSEDKDTDTGSPHADRGESDNQDAGEAGIDTRPEPEPPALPTPAVDTTLRDAIAGERSVAFPSSALVPIILVGLVAGKLPAVALTVLCAVFSTSSVDRVPVTTS